jgi:DnaK suppressor protein
MGPERYLLPMSTQGKGSDSLPRELLEELRSELEHQLRRLERSMATTDEASRPVELDQQAVGRLSRMDSLQNQHLTRNLQERERVRYAALVAALERMEEGTYGRCTECGKGIQPGRLIIYPETERCTACSG